MYRVLTKTLFGWEDCWHIDDEPMRFNSWEEAHHEIWLVLCESDDKEVRIAPLDEADFKIEEV